MTGALRGFPFNPDGRVAGALVALVLGAAPFGVGRLYSAYYLNLLTWILIYALFGAALDLALGYGGLVSFGHAGFFGVGAYAAALTIRYVAPSFWLALLMGMIVSAVMASKDRQLVFRDPHTMAVQKTLPVPCSGVNHADFSPDGSYFIVSCEFSGQLLKVDTKNRALLGWPPVSVVRLNNAGDVAALPPETTHSKI